MVFIAVALCTNLVVCTVLILCSCLFLYAALLCAAIRIRIRAEQNGSKQ
jgi:hypothetical protein